VAENENLGDIQSFFDEINKAPPDRHHDAQTLRPATSKFSAEAR